MRKSPWTVWVAKATAEIERLNSTRVIWGLLALIAGGSLVLVAAIGLPGAILMRGGFTLRAFGAMLVTANGSPASRLRVLGRALIAWFPLMLFVAVVWFGPNVQRSTATALMLTICVASVVAGALYAWRHPTRGIQDRLAGTWIVPR